MAFEEVREDGWVLGLERQRSHTLPAARAHGDGTSELTFPRSASRHAGRHRRRDGLGPFRVPKREGNPVGVEKESRPVGVGVSVRPALARLQGGPSSATSTGAEGMDAEVGESTPTVAATTDVGMVVT